MWTSGVASEDKWLEAQALFESHSSHSLFTVSTVSCGLVTLAFNETKHLCQQIKPG